MFQPAVKCAFVRRYFPPSVGWKVYVDFDASEEGRTGGERTTPAALATQQRMQEEGCEARQELVRLGVQVGGCRNTWFRDNGLPVIEGDRDIVAFHPESARCLIAEVEGQSTGQPEQKLYKAIGQLVMATSNGQPTGWTVEFVLVVHGEAISTHLSRAITLQKLGIAALSLASDPSADRWFFGNPLAHAVQWPRAQVP